MLSKLYLIEDITALLKLFLQDYCNLAPSDLIGQESHMLNLVGHLEHKVKDL